MHERYDNELSCLTALIKEYGGVDSYTTTQAATLFEQIYKMIVQLGLNPESRAEFFEGVSRIFNLEFVNMGNYEHGKYVFVPNHVSEFDGLLFGTILPNMMVVAKSDWVSNFTLIGKPVINDYTFKIDEKSEKSNWVYNALNLGVDCGETHGTVYAEMMGGYSEENENKIYDYSGVLFPEGSLSSDQTLLFDHHQIVRVDHMGLEDQEEKERE